MIAIALSAAVLGLVVQQATVEEESDKDNYEDIDNLMIGRIREENYATGNNWTSESSRIVRPTIGRKDPNKSAKEWTDYHRKYNRALQDLYVKNQIADNQRILRASVESRQRIAAFQDSTFTAAKHIPNAYVDYATAPTSDYRLDNDHSRYDDKAGNAAGATVEYIWNPANYFGVPWGPGGQLYEHLRDKSRPTPDAITTDKKVRFGGVTIF